MVREATLSQRNKLNFTVPSLPVHGDCPVLTLMQADQTFAPQLFGCFEQRGCVVVWERIRPTTAKAAGSAP